MESAERSAMSEYEGSRGELMRLLADLGEEPAFITRARAPQLALDAFLHDVQLKRDAMLKWPRWNLSRLAHQVGGNWSRVATLLVEPASVVLLESLHAQWPAQKSIEHDWLSTYKSALRRFLRSSERFNTNWQHFVQQLDLEPVNQPRRDYNQYYPLEIACAFGSEIFTKDFEPLDMIDHAYVARRFPPLTLPKMA